MNKYHTVLTLLYCFYTNRLNRNQILFECGSEKCIEFIVVSSTFFYHTWGLDTSIQQCELNTVEIFREAVECNAC